MNTDQEIATAIVRAMRDVHHVTCNHRSEGIGGPGCICVVVNKHDLQRDALKLDEAVKLFERIRSFVGQEVDGASLVDLADVEIAIDKFCSEVRK